jgi:hypothetical protein
MFNIASKNTYKLINNMNLLTIFDGTRDIGILKVITERDLGQGNENY